MAEKTLYIFVTSERPDQYLNPILHCIDREGVTRVVLVNVIEAKDNKGISDTVSRNVQLLWDSLKQGKYRYFIGEEKDNIVPLENEVSNLKDAQRLYKNLWDTKVKWDHLDINYLDLRKELNKIIKANPNSLFDITAFDKSKIGDVVSISIIGKIKNINTFDLKIRPDFEKPWTILYHDLKCDRVLEKGMKMKKYEYVNIISTPIFNECEKSILLFSIPFRITLIITPILLLIILGLYLFLDKPSKVMTVLGIVASIASIWSVMVPFTTKK